MRDGYISDLVSKWGVCFGVREKQIRVVYVLTDTALKFRHFTENYYHSHSSELEMESCCFTLMTMSSDDRYCQHFSGHLALSLSLFRCPFDLSPRPPPQILFKQTQLPLNDVIVIHLLVSQPESTKRITRIYT